VTVTHPHHPLFGQQVTVIRQRRGSDPDLIIRLADGFYGAISASWTDYAAAPEMGPPPDAPPLLDLLGLGQMAKFVGQLLNGGSPAGPNYAADEQPCSSARSSGRFKDV
jgi:hypothetical protein